MNISVILFAIIAIIGTSFFSYNIWKIKYNINLKNQKARKFTVSDFESFDIIYAMDESNYQNIIKLAKNNSHISKVKLILNEVNPLSNQSVPDPYYGGTQGFEKVYMMLEEACSVIAEKL